MPLPSSSSSSAILYENAARTIAVVDLPRSIEEAQEADVVAGLGVPARALAKRRRLLSAPAPAEPFPAAPEPLHGESHGQHDLAAQLADLTTRAAVEAALHELSQSGFRGPWCLPRLVGDGGSGGCDCVSAAAGPCVELPPHVPPGARCLAGTIAACRQQFLAEAPAFDLIVLDPPWPNRSARRRRQGRSQKTDADAGYATVADMHAMRALLEAVPVGAKLLADGTQPPPQDRPPGLVAVWVTNKPACVALLTDPKSGLFRAWGVDLVASWTWLKVTTAGEPVVPLGSQWRRPWERLLLAQARRTTTTTTAAARRWRLPPDRVIVGVPDVHSRKPNLRSLLAPFLSSPGDVNGNGRPIVGLEVFARNLTAGWWAWGDEALLFQQGAWWREEAEDENENEDAEAGRLSSLLVSR